MLSPERQAAPRVDRTYGGLVDPTGVHALHVIRYR